MRSGSLRSGLTLVVGSLMVVACDAESPTAPATTEAVAPPSLAVSTTSTSSTLSRPTLPTATVNTALVARTGKTITVAAGGNLQQAINSAVPGDEIVLKAGATYTGNFTLPKKSGSGWITIRSSASGQLPAGVRVSPSKASLMPKLVSPNGSAALRAAAGAHHWRIIGIEVATRSSATSSVALVTLGSGSRTAQATPSAAPSHIIIDRSYIHGRSTLNLKNCVELHSAHTAIIDSYLAQCHSKTQESHAIIGWNGPGPFLIENNRIEGAGINVMFGGADPASEEMMPEDITIRRNHVIKPTSWKGVWMVKNLLELKVGRRILVEGNVFENNWRDAQIGFAFVIKSVNQSGSAPWSETRDVTVRHNIVRNTAHGVSISDNPEKYPAVPASRMLFEHNVFERIGSGSYPGGRLFQVAGVDDLTLSHNTTFSTHTFMILVNKGTLSRLAVVNNLFGPTSYGLSGDGAGSGTSALNTRAPGWKFSGNVLVGAKSSIYPSGNLFPTSLSSVGFVSLSGRDYRLSSASLYEDRASDGTDPGANVSAVTALTAGVVP